MAARSSPPAKDFVSGELYYGSKLNDLLRAFGMGAAVAGQPFYVSDESEEKTYVAKIADDGGITDPKLFVEQGGESLATDDHGNVYIAAGQDVRLQSGGKSDRNDRRPRAPLANSIRRRRPQHPVHSRAQLALRSPLRDSEVVKASAQNDWNLVVQRVEKIEGLWVAALQFAESKRVSSRA